MHAREIDLEFDLDPSATRFRGHAAYRLDLDRRKRVLEFHATELEVSHVLASFSDGRGGTIRHAAQVEPCPQTETLRFRFDRLLPSGEVRLELRFRGRVRRDLRGLYRGSAPASSKQSWIATQLCPTDARRFFPCFDEPGHKACYSVSVIAPRDQTVIANAPIAREEDRPDGRKRTEFERTPPLSSYLIALAVGPFEVAARSRTGSTPIQVYTLPGQEHLARFSSTAAAESLTRLEEWFDTPHPYAKLDLVALPDFAFGAMENAGAVFFRDSILLVDEVDAKPEDLKRSAEVVAHELSHMWFGNWVTMAWWNDLWLNEAFATWMAYEIVHEWRPDWQIWLDFAHRRAEALYEDALATSHPIAPPIKSADEAQENFDAITYSKGACVLRMVERYLGPKVFQEGIRRYVRRHQESNATASDLWAALRSASGEDVEKIVAPWILQTGYPILRVEHVRRESSKQRGGRSIALAQTRFLALPRKAGAVATGKWTIPWIGRDLVRSSHAPARQLLTRKRQDLDVALGKEGILYPNAEESAFIRLDVGAELRDALRHHVTSLSAIERIGWIENLSALVRRTDVPLGEFFQLLEGLAAEGEPAVLATIERTTTAIARRLVREASPEAIEGFQTWIARVFSDGLDLGRDADRDPRRAAAQARRLSIVGGIGRAPEVVDFCERETNRYVAHATGASAHAHRVDPTRLAELLRIGVVRGARPMHDALREATLRAATPQERRCTLFALAAFEDPKLIDRSFTAALDSKLAPAPDRAGLLSLLLSNTNAAPRVWQKLQAQFGRLERSLPPIVLARLVGATSAALPATERSVIRTFFRAHPLAAGGRVVDQASEELAIAKRFEAAAAQAFEARFAR